MQPFDASVEYDLSSSNFGQAVLNSFKIQSQLYQGTGSEIFLIEDSKTQQIYTLKAVKKMPQMALNLDLLKSLSHDQIAPIVDYGESENYYYIIKPYVEGVSLKKRVQTSGLLSSEETLGMALQILSIFEYLHTLTPPMIYRDLKPDNLIIKPDGKLILIDLISIRALDTSRNNDTFYIGTKGYAAPEQYGYSQTDMRTDIYGIGATIYYLCTGKRPDNNTLKSYKPGPYDNPAYVGLMNIIQTCMHFDPEKRYQDFEALRRALIGTPQTQWVQSRATLLVIGAALIIGFTFFIYQLGRPYDAADVPIEPSSLNDTLDRDIDETISLQIPYNRDTIMSASDISIDAISQFSEGLTTLYLDDAINYQITTDALDDVYKHAMYFTVVPMTSNLSITLLKDAIYNTTIHEVDVNLVNGIGRMMPLDPENLNSFLVLLLDEHFECIGYSLQRNLQAQHSFFKETTILEAAFANQASGEMRDFLTSYWDDYYITQEDLFIVQIKEWLEDEFHHQMGRRFNYIPDYLHLVAEGQKTLTIRFDQGTLSSNDGFMSLYMCTISSLPDMVPGIPYKIIDPHNAGWVIPENLVIMR